MKIAPIIRADILNIFRDKSLIMIMIVPALIAVLLKTVPPLYELHFPGAVLYRPLILGIFCMVVSALAGFLIAFSMLDEKDINLIQVFRIMPLPFEKLLLVRLGFIAMLSFVFSGFLILVTRFINLSCLQAFTLSVLCSSIGPLSTLVVVGMASNKIEGVTYFKLFTLLLALPLAGIFLQVPAKYFFGLIPFYWFYKAFLGYSAPGSFYLYCFTGFITVMFALVLSYKFLLKRIQ